MPFAAVAWPPAPAVNPKARGCPPTRRDTTPIQFGCSMQIGVWLNLEPAITVGHRIRKSSGALILSRQTRWKSNVESELTFCNCASKTASVPDPPFASQYNA